MKKIDYILLGVILLLGIAFRLYHLSAPLSDLHSWRQADTAAVARNYSRNGVDLLNPRYDDLSSIQSGIENPQGLRYVEFPIYNAIVGFIHRYLPVTSVEVYGRLVSAFFSLISISVLYYFLRKERSRISAIFGSGVFAIFPYFVFFSRTVLPETTAVSWMMLSLFFLYLHLNNTKSGIFRQYVFYGLSVIFYAGSILIKPTTIFYSIAIAYLFFSYLKLKAFTTWKTYVFVLLGIVPFVGWRLYIQQFPAGIPASTWLFTTVNTFEGPKNIFFKPAFFRWMFKERIGEQILGIYLAGIATAGLVLKQKSYFLFSIIISSFVYIFTFQGGNVQHEYYQIVLFPGIALMVGLGVASLAESKILNRFLLYPMIIGVFVLSFLFSWYTVESFYHTPKDLTQIAQLIQSFTTPEDLVVTDRNGDTTLLYLADRKGSPAVYKDTPTLISLGYSYLLTDNSDFASQLKSEGYIPLVENEQFSFFKLEKTP